MKKGNSLLEIIIALSIFALILGAIGNLSFSNQFLSQNSDTAFLAQEKARFLIENAKANLAGNFYPNISSSSTTSLYTQNISVIDLSNFIREIVATVSWSEKGRNLSIQLRRLIGNWQEAVGSDDCFLDGTENWQTPQVFGNIDLGYGNVATGLKVRGGFAYLTSNNIDPRNPEADKNDFFIVDVQNPSSAAIISRTDTGPGLSSIALAGNYAYLGNTSINGQLQIFDIHDPSNPNLRSSYKLPGQYSDGTTVPNNLFYNKAKLYLGTAKSQIEEFHIINVEDPLHPQEIGKWEVNAGINAIYESGQYAYIALPSNEELSILDVSNPTHIVRVGGFDAPGGSGNGKSLAKNGNILYLGRTVGTNELFALDISNPANIVSFGSKTISNSINGLTVFGSRIFLGTNNKFMVMDAKISSNIQLISSLDIGSKATGIVCSNKLIYLSLQSNKGLKIIGPSP